jgi:hypothetical protein
LPVLNFFRLVVATAMWPFNTFVNISLIEFFCLEKQIVLVTSVVPNLYCPPESHKKISLFLIVLLDFLTLYNVEEQH